MVTVRGKVEYFDIVQGAQVDGVYNAPKKSDDQNPSNLSVRHYRDEKYNGEQP
jgi:hypothetical protein